jgi:hypothetical protein
MIRAGRPPLAVGWRCFCVKCLCGDGELLTARQLGYDPEQHRLVPTGAPDIPTKIDAFDLRRLLGMEGNQSMQIRLNAEVPRSSTRTPRRRRPGYIDAPYVLEPPSEAMDGTVSVLAEILDKSQAPRQDGVARLADDRGSDDDGHAAARRGIVRVASRPPREPA